MKYFLMVLVSVVMIAACDQVTPTKATVAQDSTITPLVVDFQPEDSPSIQIDSSGVLKIGGKVVSNQNISDGVKGLLAYTTMANKFYLVRDSTGADRVAIMGQIDSTMTMVQRVAADSSFVSRRVRHDAVKIFADAYDPQLRVWFLTEYPRIKF